MTCQKSRKKSLIFPSNGLLILKKSGWIMKLTLFHKRIKLAKNMSIEILASKFLVVMGTTYRRLSHTVLSGIVSCVLISEQDV